MPLYRASSGGAGGGAALPEGGLPGQVLGTDEDGALAWVDPAPADEGGTTDALIWQGAWNPYTTYPVNSVVKVGSTLYRAPTEVAGAPSAYGDPADLAGYNVYTGAGLWGDDGTKTAPLTDFPPGTELLSGERGFLVAGANFRVLDAQGRPYVNVAASAVKPAAVPFDASKWEVFVAAPPPQGGATNLTNGTGSYSFTNQTGATAVGDAAASIGYSTHAHGMGSLTSGTQSVAHNSYAVALGENTRAFGIASVAEGGSTRAGSSAWAYTGMYAHAEGYATVADGGTGYNSGGQHAEGIQTQATGSHGAHAEGFSTVASGSYGAHAEGNQTTASGIYAHSQNSLTTASGNASTAMGASTIASGERTVALGLQSRATQHAQVAHSSGQFAVAGDAQYSRMVLRAITNNSFTGVLTPTGTETTSTNIDPSSAGVNSFLVGANRRVLFRIDVIGASTSGAATFQLVGFIDNAGGFSVATTRIHGTDGDGWTCVAASEALGTANRYLVIRVKAPAGNLARWVGTTHLTEVAL